jgi:phage terminase Nu1 subunit (DNA packaging protein)
VNTTPDTKGLIKKKQLAALLGVSPRTVDNWVQQRLIPHLAINDRLHLFDPAAVRAALAARFEVRAESPATRA